MQLPSTDAIDRQGKKNLHMHMKVQGRIMKAHFIEIPQVFAKKRSDTFLTEKYIWTGLHELGNTHAQHCLNTIVLLYPYIKSHFIGSNKILATGLVLYTYEGNSLNFCEKICNFNTAIKPSPIVPAQSYAM